MKTGSEAAEASADDIRRRGLDGTGSACHGGRARVLDDGESTVDEGNTACSVIYANVELAAARATHHIRLDLLLVEDAGALSRASAERGNKLEKVVDLDRGVHLGQLQQKTGKKGMLQKGEVRSVATISLERLEEGRDSGAESQRIEGDLENIVQLLNGLR